MNKIEKEVYETPIIMKQQVILEQVIAASPQSEDNVLSTWSGEDIDNGDVIFI
ncbi:hypothetical protein [Phocaeicola sp.]